MGMAASQVRFLSLQHRKNSIGRQLSTLSNRKMSLSRDMNQVSRNYTNALNQINLKWSNDCGNTYHALSYDMLMKPNDVNAETPYILTNARNGKVILNDTALYDQEGNKIMTGEWSNVGGQNFPAGELSYLRIAQMISSFTGISDDGEEIYCNNTNAYAKDENGNWVGQANPGAYYIPANDEFSFDNNLRMKIFMLMGLVTQDQIDTQNSLLTELYGSQEAKETGVYPVGTAWGDYYIALANLEAYDHYLASKQTLSTAGTYKDTAKESKTYRETIGDYSYTTEVNGIAGDSYCKQTSASTGALSHVNFNAGVVKDETTGLYVEYSSDEAEWNSDAINNLFDDEKYDATIDSADTTWGASFSHTLSKNSGMTYEYTYNDVLQNAIDNFNANTDGAGELKVGDFDVLAALTDTSNDEEVRCMVVASKVNCYHSAWSGALRDRAKPNIDALCDSFKSLLLNNTMVDIDEQAHEKAKAAVWNMLNNNVNTKSEGTSGCPQDVADRSQDRALNNVGIYLNRHKIEFWCGGPTVHRARAAASVDVKQLFNTYMTYYSYYAKNPDKECVGTDMSSIPNISVEEEYEEPSVTSTLQFIGGKPYLVSTSTIGKDENGNEITVQDRILLTTNVAETDSSTEVYKFASATNGAALSDSGIVSYYAASNEDANASITYYKNRSNNGNTYTYTNDAGETVTNNVFATIQLGDELHYCTTSAEVTAYLTSGTFPSSADPIENEVETPTLPISFLEGDVNNPSEDKINLNSTAANTYFDIRLQQQQKDDPAYRKHLVDAVNAAQLRITQLEADINEFYSDSDKKIMDYYDAIFLRIAEQGWEQDEYTKNDAYLNNKIQNNDFFLTECLQKNSSTGFRYTAKQATNISKIFSVHDTNAEQEALVEYESEKRRLQYKENAIDTRMRILETEQEAINTEMESVQKVCNDNISKYFKIFA